MKPNVRILSGIQPSGTIHIGNYFGMIKPLLDLRERGDLFCFIADYHSMTSLFDAKQRYANTLKAATTLIAFSELNSKYKVNIWRQSDVPAVAELAWILSTLTPTGALERCHSYKDKVARGIPTNHGLFAYPVLMAADILMYNANLVPVGRDQMQHLEIARDLAIKFNKTYGKAFVVPEPHIQPESAIVPGTDGQKMSKSHGNIINIFGAPKLIKKQIMSIVMDSRGVNEPKPDADKNTAIQLLRLLAPIDVATDVETRLREGKLGYGELKNILFEEHQTYFRKAQDSYDVLQESQDYVEEILNDGAYDAARIAAKNILKIKDAVGLTDSVLNS